jgi:hypothetical protein
MANGQENRLRVKQVNQFIAFTKINTFLKLYATFSEGTGPFESTFQESNSRELQWCIRLPPMKKPRSFLSARSIKLNYFSGFAEE